MICCDFEVANIMNSSVVHNNDVFYLMDFVQHLLHRRFLVQLDCETSIFFLCKSHSNPFLEPTSTSQRT